MILSPDGMTAVSSWGWTEQGKLHVFDAQNRSSRIVDVEVARGTSCTLVHAGEGGYFTAHHPFFGTPRDVITLHHFDSVDEPPLATLHLTAETEHADPEIWRHAPRYYTTFLHGAPALVAIRASGNVEINEMAWFDSRYDHDWQAPGDPVYNGYAEETLVGVQRSSEIVRLDPVTCREVGRCPLLDRGGNPTPLVLKTRPEIWAVDYDVVVKLDARNYSRLGAHQAQLPEATTNLFAGDLAFDPSEEIVVIARPFSNDIQVLDTYLNPQAVMGVDHQPLSAAIFADRTVLSRDWKSGDHLWLSLPRHLT